MFFCEFYKMFMNTHLKEHLQTAALKNWEYFISSKVSVCKKCVPKNFTKFTEKQLCLSLFWIKLIKLITSSLQLCYSYICVFLRVLQKILEHLFSRTSGHSCFSSFSFIRRFFSFDVGFCLNQMARAGNRSAFHLFFSL